MADGFWSQAGTLLTGQGSSWKDLGKTLKTEVTDAAPALMAIGAINSAIGSFYQTKSAQISYDHQAKMAEMNAKMQATQAAYQAQSRGLQSQMAAVQMLSQASAARFSAAISGVNAAQAEFQAQTILEAGAREIGRATMAAGQRRGRTKASLAARGIQAGVGTAAEIVASGDIVSEIDALTLNANRVRQAAQARMQRVQAEPEQRMATAQARGLEGMADVTEAYAAQMPGLSRQWERYGAGISIPSPSAGSPWLAAGTSLLTGLGSLALLR